MSYLSPKAIIYTMDDLERFEAFASSGGACGSGGQDPCQSNGSCNGGGSCSSGGNCNNSGSCSSGGHMCVTSSSGSGKPCFIGANICIANAST